MVSSFAVDLGKGIVKGKMEDQVMKGAQEVEACSLKLLPLVRPWEACQLLFYLDPGNFLANFLLFCSHEIALMSVPAVMKKIWMEAGTQVTQVVLVIQTWCQHLMYSLVDLGLLKGMDPEGASLGR